MAELTKKQQKEVKQEVKEEVQKEVKDEVTKEVSKQIIQQRKILTQKLAQKSAAFHGEFKKQISTALLTAFGLVIALSWQDLIKKIMENAKPETTSHPYLAALYTALIVTFFAVIGMMVITKWAKKPKTP